MRFTASPRSALPSKKRVTSSMPSMNTKLRTRENWLARAWTSWRVKRAKLATDPEMSATTMISGFVGWGRREGGAARPPAPTDRGFAPLPEPLDAGGQLLPGQALLQLVGEAAPP